MLYDQVSILRGKAYNDDGNSVQSTKKKSHSTAVSRKSEPKSNNLAKAVSWFGGPRKSQQQKKQESENKITTKEVNNTDCYELEVEIIKLRRQVERIIAVDTKIDEADNGASTLVYETREKAKNVTEECRVLMEKVSVLEKRKLAIDLEIDKYVQERSNNMKEIEKIEEENRDLKRGNLNKIAEMEQMEFFHEEMRVLFAQFLMNKMNLEMELEKDKVKYFKLEADYKDKMYVMKQIEREIEQLKKKVKNSEKNLTEAKERTQVLSKINDKLHQDLDVLKSSDCDQIIRDEINLRWAESADSEKKSTIGVHVRSTIDCYSERQLQITSENTKNDGDSTTNQTA